MSPLSEKAKRMACFCVLLLLAGLVTAKLLADLQTQETSSGELKQGVAYFYHHAACPGKPVDVITLDYPEFSSTCRWSVGGNPISHTGFSYTPTEDDLEQMITATVEAEGYAPQTLSVYCSRLPVLYIDVDSGSDAADKHTYESAYYQLQSMGESGCINWEGPAQVKGRGNVSWFNPKHPYRLKLESKENLLDMGENKHWTLIPNYTDPSLMRNTLAYGAAEAIGLISMDTEWVSLVFNGSYVGNYQLCQQIRPGSDRVPVADLEDASRQAAKKILEEKILPPDKAEALENRLKDDLSWMSTGIFEFEGQEYPIPATVEKPSLTGGFILEIDEYFDEPSKFTTRMEQPVLFHSPENAWSNQELMDYAIHYIQAIEDAIYAEDHRTIYQEISVHYSDLADLDSLVKYWLISEFFYNEDLGRKSVFLYKNVGQKVFMGPIWDMDWSSGGSENTTMWNQWATLSFSASAQENMWYKQLVKDPYFVSRACQLYHEYHPVFHDIVQEGGLIDKYYGYLYESGLANDALWNTDRTFPQDALEILKPWLENRLDWMDRQFLSEETLWESLNPE